jgi:hypothetical protein
VSWILGDVGGCLFDREERDGQGGFCEKSRPNKAAVGELNCKKPTYHWMRDQGLRTEMCVCALVSDVHGIPAPHIYPRAFALLSISAVTTRNKPTTSQRCSGSRQTLLAARRREESAKKRGNTCASGEEK